MLGPHTDVQQARRRMTENRAWLDHNLADLQKDYANRWVLVLGQQVVAADETAAGLGPHLSGHEDEAILFRVPAGELSRPI